METVPQTSGTFMTKTVTIKDVAKRAKVGVGTVSRVINENPAVSEATRQRVLEAIEDLNYIPNPIARRLSLGKTQTIGVVLPYLTLPSYVERLRGVQHALEDTGYDLVLYGVGNSEKKDVIFSQLSRSFQVDGVITISVYPTEQQANSFIQANAPIVLVDSYHPDLISIMVDDRRVGQIATQHLLDLGHQEIGFVGDQLQTPFHASTKLRFEGYQQALEKAGLTLNLKYHREGELGGGDAYHIALDLLSIPNPPTAIFASSDIYAVGVLKAARHLKINVPEGLSIIGCDGIRDSEYLSITTIQQPLFESGVLGVETLLHQMSNPLSISRKIEMPVELVQRETTAFAA